MLLKYEIVIKKYIRGLTFKASVGVSLLAEIKRGFPREQAL